MKVSYSDRVKTSLSNLTYADRERVRTWFLYLENWDRDPFVKTQSVPLQVNGRRVYLFRTSTDVRIFYTVDESEQTIYVLDVTNKDNILSSGAV